MIYTISQREYLVLFNTIRIFFIDKIYQTIKTFLKLCPHADDVWFKVMTMLKGTLCEHIPTPHFDSLFIPLDIDETSSLQSINVINGGNDRQIKAVFDYYHIKK